MSCELVLVAGHLCDSPGCTTVVSPAAPTTIAVLLDDAGKPLRRTLRLGAMAAVARGADSQGVAS